MGIYESFVNTQYVPFVRASINTGRFAYLLAGISIALFISALLAIDGDSSKLGIVLGICLPLVIPLTYISMIVWSVYSIVDDNPDAYMEILPSVCSDKGHYSYKDGSKPERTDHYSHLLPGDNYENEDVELFLKKMNGSST